MPVVILKSRAVKREAQAKLVAQVSAEASSLLDQGTHRVLVVYGDQDACLYYEGQGTPPRSRTP